MNKRQRKKHRLGEFRQFGFELRFCTPKVWSGEDQGAFWHTCIARIEALGLSVGGGTGACWDVLVTGLRDRDTVTSEQRQALLAWLAARPDVSEIRAGELEDAWYPPARPDEPAA
jgi:uncharacterized protein YggL (DUF469 family)